MSDQNINLMDERVSRYILINRFYLYSSLLEKMILEFLRNSLYFQTETTMQSNYEGLLAQWKKLQKYTKTYHSDVTKIMFPDKLISADITLSKFSEENQIHNKKILNEIKNIIDTLSEVVNDLEDNNPNIKYHIIKHKDGNIDIKKKTISKFLEEERLQDTDISEKIEQSILAYKIRQEDADIGDFSLNGNYIENDNPSFIRKKNGYVLEVFPKSGKVILNNKEIVWSNSDEQFQLLSLIARHDGDILPYKRILGGKDGFTPREKLRKQISKINKKLGLKIILSVTGQGYYLGDNEGI